jgi:protein-S-isoprenylcysteine O-methyltransferase Ste14
MRDPAILRLLALGAIFAWQLFFLDAPFLTIGQDWVVRRSNERNSVLALELTLIGLWACLVFLLQADRPVVGPGRDFALASIGAPIVCAGAALAVWGKLRLGKWFSATFAVKRGHVLVTDGPYAVTRHPIYTGLLTIVLGGALTWNSALTLALLPLLSATLYVHTVFEELLFVQYFGDAYAEYRRRVPRLVPFISPGGRA